VHHRGRSGRCTGRRPRSPSCERRLGAPKEKWARKTL